MDSSALVGGIPQPLIWGSKRPRISLRLLKDGTQRHCCEENHNLLLRAHDVREGTYQAGRFLAALCESVCQPERDASDPCPAFVDGHTIDMHGNDLATVSLRQAPRFHKCGGVQYLSEVCGSESEVVFLETYLDMMSRHGSLARSAIGVTWNDEWASVKPWGAMCFSRRDAFDALMWDTLAFPALIPQVVINVLPPGERDRTQKPCRLDFVAYADSRLHAIEIDGASHFADVMKTESGLEYRADGKVYAMTLRASRYLESAGWQLRRIANEEVADLRVQSRLEPRKAREELGRMTLLASSEPDLSRADEVLGMSVWDHPRALPF